MFQNTLLQGLKFNALTTLLVCKDTYWIDLQTLVTSISIVYAVIQSKLLLRQCEVLGVRTVVLTHATILT